MATEKQNSINLLISPNDKEVMTKEEIIFIDSIPSGETLVLLSSNNNIFLCHISNDSFKITKKLVNIINNPKSKINSCYFCNGNKNILLLFCDELNIIEYTIDRGYISHIYYNSLGHSFLFKMNSQKNSNPQYGISNFCILKDQELKVWNTLKYNKSNVLCVPDIKCFSYDSTGVVLYVSGKNSNNNCFLGVIKFMNEYECKEIFFKTLDFVEPVVEIDYLDIFDNNIFMFDKISNNIYIFKNYPINNFDFSMPLNKIICPKLFVPFIGEKTLYEFGIICVDFKQKKKKYYKFSYSTNRVTEGEIDLDIKETFYFKENINDKGLLLTFDNGTKKLKKYLI